MTRLFVLLLALLPNPCFGVYAKKIPLTIGSGKVVGGPHTNYTFTIDRTIADLKHTGSGGFVTSTNGYDIVPSQDSDCSTKLNFKREYYGSTDGHIVMYGNKSAFAQADTVWLCFADATVTVDQQNATAAYDSNHKAVYHFPDGSSLSGLDATSNGHNLTTNSLSAVAGAVGTGAAFGNGSGTFYATATSTAALNVTAPISISGWLYTDTVINGLSWIHKGSGSQFRYYIGTYSSGKANCQLLDNTTSYVMFLGSTNNIPTNTWTHVACTCDGTTGYLYFNGVQEATGSCSSGNNGGGSSDLTVAYASYDSRWDDIKLQSAARSQGWWQTEYNLRDQSTFWSVGATQDNVSVSYNPVVTIN